MGWRTVGRQIRTIRERRGFTREQLAARAGLSAVYVKKLEAAERLAPSLPMLARIAKALGTVLRVELVEKPSREGGKGDS